MASLTLQGSSSGQITLATPAVAGTNTITLPAATGTVLTTAGGQTISGTVTLSTLTSPAATALTIQSAGTTAMTIDTSQNVGIGTSSPSAKLDVKSQINVTNSSNGSMLGIKGTNFGYSSSYQAIQVGNSSGNNTVALGYDPAVNSSGAFSGDGSEIITRDGVKFIQPNGTTAWYLNTLVLSGGNVGIGTTSPAVKTEIQSGAETLRLSRSTSGSVYLGFAQGGTRKAYLESNNADVNLFAEAASSNMIFGTVGTERMRIDSSGQLILKRTAAVNAATIVCSTGQNSRQVSFVNNNNNNEVGYIFCNNDGTTTQYATTSDYRLKEDVEPLQNSLNVICSLNPVTYKWKSSNAHGEGFLAHELQKHIPLAVNGTKDDTNEEGNPVYQGVDYSKIVVHLVAACQEQQAIISDLQSRIAALEAK